MGIAAAEMAVQIYMPLWWATPVARSSSKEAMAQMAADAYAHAIRPTHTTNDGDTIYVMASGTADMQDCPLDLLGLLATRALEAAICEGCRTADGILGTPSCKDLAR